MNPEGEGGSAVHPLVVRVWDTAMAERAAAAADSLGVPLTLLSAPSAAIHGGIGWYSALASSLAARYPRLSMGWILDCGDRTGTAVAAIEAGCPVVVFTGSAEAAERLRRLGAEREVVLLECPPAALLPRPGGDFVAACRDWIERKGCGNTPNSRRGTPK